MVYSVAQHINLPTPFYTQNAVAQFSEHACRCNFIYVLQNSKAFATANCRTSFSITYRGGLLHVSPKSDNKCGKDRRPFTPVSMASSGAILHGTHNYVVSLHEDLTFRIDTYRARNMDGTSSSYFF
jgi:hypothetical protein